MFVEPIYGPLPDGWRLASLGTLVDAGVAEMQTGPFGTMLKASSYVAEGTPVIAVAHIGDNTIIHRDLPRVGPADVQRLAGYKLQPGDIVFGRKGAVSRRGFITESEAGWLQGSDCIRLRITSRTVSAAYVSYVLGSPAYREFIERNAQGATMPSLNQEILRRVPIPLADARTQRLVAGILGTLDDKIELNRRMNETLEEMARAIFKSWFVDFGPVKAKMDGRKPYGMDAETAALFPDSFGDSEIGRIPTGWAAGTLGNVATESRGTVKPESIDPTTPYIGLEHLPRRQIAIPSWGTAADVGSAKRPIAQGQILFGKLRPYFHKVGPAPVSGVCSTDIVVVNPRDTEFRSFVLMCMSDVIFVNYTDGTSTGTRMPRTKWSDMAGYRVPIPPPGLVRRYAAVADPMLRRIQASRGSLSRCVNRKRRRRLPRTNKPPGRRPGKGKDTPPWVRILTTVRTGQRSSTSISNLTSVNRFRAGFRICWRRKSTTCWAARSTRVVGRERRRLATATGMASHAV